MEVGAGVGAHALTLAASVGAEGHLFLYESRRVVQRVLWQNLAANRVTNATVMRRALSRGREAEAIAPGSAALASRSNPAIPVANEILDELQLERLDWLKINAGVSALEILKGAAETLWRLRPLLFSAVPDELALTEFASRVTVFSYRCWRMETPLFNPENFNHRKENIFSARTALALLAIPEEIEVDILLEGCEEIP